MKKATKKELKMIAQNQIYRMAKIWLSKSENDKINSENLDWYHRVLQLQVSAIRWKKSI